MSPQNWLCRSERKPALDTQAPNSPLVHINGDNAYSPPVNRHEIHGDIQSSIPTTATSFVKNAKDTIPHTSRNTRCHLNISLRHFLSNTNKPKLHESCSTKSKPYSMLQIKNFLCCVVKEKFGHSFVFPKKI